MIELPVCQHRFNIRERLQRCSCKSNRIAGNKDNIRFGFCMTQCPCVNKPDHEEATPPSPYPDNFKQRLELPCVNLGEQVTTYDVTPCGGRKNAGLHFCPEYGICSGPINLSYVDESGSSQVAHWQGTCDKYLPLLPDKERGVDKEKKTPRFKFNKNADKVPCTEFVKGTGRLELCLICGDRNEKEVMQCNKHGTCTKDSQLIYVDKETGKIVEVRWCKTCGDYEAGASNDSQPQVSV